MQSNVIETMLDDFASRGEDISITLRDGSSVRGKVDRFDGYVIMLSGVNPQIVYRHSILKLMPAAQAEQKPAGQRPRASERPERPERREYIPRAPQPPRTSRPKPGYTDKRPAKEPEKSGDITTMGEAMMKWLKSQKGNE